jgi:hypothetical protein
MATTATWHTTEHDSTWERVKAAFRRDWEQTKNDFGSDRARDLDQDVDDTFKQMFGKQSGYNYRDLDFKEEEPAFRYGHAARRHFGSTHKSWNPTLRENLRKDYTGDWKRDEPLIRYAYSYDQYR